jgi:hypothetical protein
MYSYRLWIQFLGLTVIALILMAIVFGLMTYIDKKQRIEQAERDQLYKKRNPLNPDLILTARIGRLDEQIKQRIRQKRYVIIFVGGSGALLVLRNFITIIINNS